MSILKTCNPPSGDAFHENATVREHQCSHSSPLLATRLQSDARRTAAAPSRLLEQQDTHIKSDRNTCWLVLLRRHKHLHREVKKRRVCPHWIQCHVCEEVQQLKIFLQHPSWSESTERLKGCFSTDVLFWRLRSNTCACYLINIHMTPNPNR